MTLPKPVPGLLIRYSYLWREEYLAGREEGVKDRPCAVVLTTEMDNGEEMVTVLPVTHSIPREGVPALEIPPTTKRRLGLDEERSWIILNEANRFIWPGPDIRPVRRNDPASVAYGILPYTLALEMISRFAENVGRQRGKVVRRSE